MQWNLEQGLCRSRSWLRRAGGNDQLILMNAIDISARRPPTRNDGGGRAHKCYYRTRVERAVELKLALEINGRIEITFHPSARRCTHGQDTGIGQLCKPYQGIRQCFDVARRIERAGFLLAYEFWNAGDARTNDGAARSA